MYILNLEIRYNDEYVSAVDSKLRTWNHHSMDDLKISGDDWVSKVEEYEVDRKYFISKLLPSGRSKVVYKSWE